MGKIFTILLKYAKLGIVLLPFYWNMLNWVLYELNLEMGRTYY